MSVETDIDNLRKAMTLLVEGQRIETGKRQNLETLALALSEAAQRQFASMEVLRAGLTDMRDNHANLEAKFAALVDAQIRTEGHFSQLAATVNQLAVTVSKLADRNGSA